MSDIRTIRRFETVLATVLVFATAFLGIRPALGAPGHEHGVAVEVVPLGGDDDGGFTGIINSLKDDIEGKKDEVSSLQNQMKSYEAKIAEKRKEAATVSNQLSLIENKIAKLKLDIETSELQIEQTDLEIQELDLQIEDKTLKLIRQRELVGEFLRTLHRTDRRTAIDIFLTEQTLADFFNDVQFIEDSQRELKTQIDTAKLLRSDLEERKVAASAKRDRLEEIKEELELQQEELGEQQVAQVQLAEQVAASESEYRYLVAQIRREINNINSDIVAIEKQLRKTLDQERLRRLSGGTTGWQWPVDPSRGITAFFQDPDYPYRHIFEHSAIDVRAAQGTPIRATKGGYVARARDNGMGYSYVMIVHDQGLSSVYGHMSRIYVKADTFIEKGEVIGLSGGMPGTPGAGSYSTGPHLHFEIRLNGIPVNPLNYLKY